MRNTVVMLLAGGGGTRLSILAHMRAKPAVPFGGMYRIIDFTLSNVMNSGIGSVAVLTQYKPISLMDHLGTGEPWDMIGRTRGVKILPPRTGIKDSDWYRGTADAIRQNIEYIHQAGPKQVLILSGDHIYDMDYRPMILFHQERKANLTIAMMSVRPEETRHFGMAVTDSTDRILQWEEKPEKTDSNLASMGVYVFDAAYLLDVLGRAVGNDFGNHVVPKAIEDGGVFAYPFQGYWKDVGTLHSYWEANRDLLDPRSGIDLEGWRVRTNLEEVDRLGDRPPAWISPSARISESLICPGCVIEGEVIRSVLSPGVRVAKGARVNDSVLMNDTSIGRGARVNHLIADKSVRIGEEADIGFGDSGTPNRAIPQHLFTGLTVAGKKAAVPSGCRIGQNSILYPALREGDYPSLEIEAGSTLLCRDPGVP